MVERVIWVAKATKKMIRTISLKCHIKAHLTLHLCLKYGQINWEWCNNWMWSNSEECSSAVSICLNIKKEKKSVTEILTVLSGKNAEFYLPEIKLKKKISLRLLVTTTHSNLRMMSTNRTISSSSFKIILSPWKRKMLMSTQLLLAN